MMEHKCSRPIDTPPPRLLAKLEPPRSHQKQRNKLSSHRKAGMRKTGDDSAKYRDNRIEQADISNS